MEKIKVINLSGNKMPMYETEGSVGMDLRAWVSSDKTKPIEDSFIQSREDTQPVLYIRPGGRVLIDTGLKFQLPPNVEGMVRPRSGLTAKQGLVAQIGTIDSDYRGRVFVTLVNLGSEVCVVRNADRIAQIVFNEIKRFELELATELDETERGEGGIGHTGTK